MGVKLDVKFTWVFLVMLAAALGFHFSSDTAFIAHRASMALIAYFGLGLAFGWSHLSWVGKE